MFDNDSGTPETYPYPLVRCNRTGTGITQASYTVSYMGVGSVTPRSRYSGGQIALHNVVDNFLPALIILHVKAESSEWLKISLQ